MQLVDEIVHEKIVPELATQQHEDVAVALLLERGELRVCVRPGNDAGVVPGRQLARRETVGDYDFLNRPKARGDLASDAGGSNIREIAARFRTIEKIVDRKSTRLNSSHGYISYAVFCLKKKKKYVPGTKK